MGKIIAIGGGEIKDGETKPIDRRILELTGKSKPKLLFLPTASGDSEGYWQTMKKVFGEELGANTDVLMLTKGDLSDETIQEKILFADAIYVGGGNTQKMLKLWRKYSVDKYLKRAFEQGIVLSGLSAGAICWFEYGSTDSPKFDNPDNTEYVLIHGLGFAKGLISPHHIREPQRIKRLPELVKEAGVAGFGIDDNAAIEIIDYTFRGIASKPGVGVEKIYFDENGNLHQEKIISSVL